jgi:hypothetical protein
MEGAENGKNKGNEEKELKMWKLSSTEIMPVDLFSTDDIQT